MEDAAQLPWEWVLPTATAIAVGEAWKYFISEDADSEKIIRFPQKGPRRMPDIPDEIAAVVVAIASMLLLRGSARSLGTARVAERLGVSGLAGVPPGPNRLRMIMERSGIWKGEHPIQVGVRRSSGTVESPYGRGSGRGTRKRLEGARKRREERERRRSEGQAGQFESFGARS